MGTSSTAAAPEPLRDLILRVRNLEHRIDNIEQRLGDLSISVGPTEITKPPHEADVDAKPALPPNFLSVVGRVLLVIAGAYVLRSLTDFGVMPRAAPCQLLAIATHDSPAVASTPTETIQGRGALPIPRSGESGWLTAPETIELSSR